jgi:4-amino-4-deoxy-L-arabinose transferase-like glycosyltransferase
MSSSLAWLPRFAPPLAVFLLALFLNAHRIDKAPDIHGDEIMYYQGGVNVAKSGELTWLENTPIWVHPPLFFLVEGLLTSIAPPNRNIFEGIYSLRWLCCLLGALTALLIYEFVRFAFGARAALVASLLFLLDPFVVRICRRIMLESQMQLFVVAGMFLFFRYRHQFTWTRIGVVSLLLGLALLTKELAVISLGSCLLFCLFRRRRKLLQRAVIAATLAVGVWSTYPAWAVASGKWSEFREAKLFGVERLAGVVPTTSWKNPAVSLANAPKTTKYQHLQNLPRISLREALVANGIQYASSYALIVFAPFLALYLWWRRRDDASLFVLSWLLTTGVFLGVSSLLGTLHVQFVYMIMPPTCVAAGVALAPRAASPRAASLLDGIRLLLLGVILVFGAWRWVFLFGFGTDNSYHRLAQYVEEHVPTNAVINASQPVRIEPASRWLFPHHTLASLRDPKKLARRHIRYAILGSKDVWAGYGRLSTEYVSWLRANGRRVFHAYGNTYWDLELIEISPAADPAGASSDQGEGAP